MTKLLSWPGRGRRITPYRVALQKASDARDKGDWALAAEQYGEAFRLSPSSMELLMQLGHCMKEQGKYAEAHSFYREYAGARPGDREVQVHVQFVLARLSVSGERAKSPESPLMGDKPDSVLGREREDALLAFEEKRWSDAIPLLEGLCHRAGFSDLFCLLGHAAKESGDFATAGHAYQNYLRYAEQSQPASVADAYLQLGHLYKVKGLPHEAFSMYAKALEKVGENAENLKCEIQREVRALVRYLFPTFAIGDAVV